MANTNQAQIKRVAIYIVVGLIVVVSFVAGYKAWRLRAEAQWLEGEAKAGPHVDVVEATQAPTERQLSLVGEARPYASVTLYAKVSGYLKEVKVDKGDVVKKDQLLAVIESPEIDKDYQGAVADTKNKKSIAGRMTQLRARNLVSPQEADQADSDFAVAQSKLESLAVQKGYEILRAPFDGTVTSRYADAGALVQNAANSQTSALPVVTISQVNRLRIYVYVDQRDASFIQVGSPCLVTVEERPDLQLTAVVSRVTGELDPKTKMLLTEIDVENTKGQLVPGSFVQVKLNIRTPPYLELPVQAMVVVQGKTFVPLVDSEDNVHLREVRAGANDGKTVVILDGIKQGERVALNLGTSVSDGDHVRPNAKKAAEPQKGEVPKAAASQQAEPTKAVETTPATPAPAAVNGKSAEK
jgi:membrane fusion protein (multidrug efflux system)